MDGGDTSRLSNDESECCQSKGSAKKEPYDILGKLRRFRELTLAKRKQIIILKKVARFQCHWSHFVANSNTSSHESPGFFSENLANCF
jgi:hypothetical protein